MRYDRGTRIFTYSTTKVGQPVWAPIWRGWYPCKVVHVSQALAALVQIDCEAPREVRMDSKFIPLWQLRERRLHLEGRDKPDEPSPPTHGRPRGIKLFGILTNGSVRGRC